MAKTLSEFKVAKGGEDYLLSISTDDGETLEVGASFEQLDLIAEAIEAQLDEDEENALEVAEE